MAKPLLPLQDQLRGFSRALFSTWLYHRRFNLLFDAGEGMATALLNRVFGIRRVFLSHGHADHIAGLINLVNIRNLGAGDQTADLTIHYPRNNTLIEVIRDYLSRTQSELSFSLRWQPMDADEVVFLDQKREKLFLRTFRTQHSHKQLSLGFNIVEKRWRLRPDFLGKTQEVINQAIWQTGKEAVAETFEQTIFSYGGDSRPIPAAAVKESLFLCHECTYLKAEDDERNFHQHSVLDEVLETAKAAGVKALLLFHVSLRYTMEEIRDRVAEGVKRIQPGCRVLVLHGDRYFDAVSGGAGPRFSESADEAETVTIPPTGEEQE